MSASAFAYGLWWCSIRYSLSRKKSWIEKEPEASLQSKSVLVQNLPLKITTDQVKQVFGHSLHYPILRLKLFDDDAKARSAALIEFDGLFRAKWVVEMMHGNIPDGLAEPIQARFLPPDVTFAAEFIDLDPESDTEERAW